MESRYKFNLSIFFKYHKLGFITINKNITLYDIFLSSIIYIETVIKRKLISEDGSLIFFITAENNRMLNMIKINNNFESIKNIYLHSSPNHLTIFNNKTITVNDNPYYIMRNLYIFNQDEQCLELTDLFHFHKLLLGKQQQYCKNRNIKLKSEIDNDRSIYF